MLHILKGGRERDYQDFWNENVSYLVCSFFFCLNMEQVCAFDFHCELCVFQSWKPHCSHRIGCGFVGA